MFYMNMTGSFSFLHQIKTNIVLKTANIPLVLHPKR